MAQKRRRVEKHAAARSDSLLDKLQRRKIQRTSPAGDEQVMRDQDALLFAQLAGRPAAVQLPSRPEDSRVAPSALASNTRKAFNSHLRKAIAESDVVIEVLDARDPNGFRSNQVEEDVLSAGKRLVLLLNKIDLVQDQTQTEKWVAHLKRFFPTLSFRSMTTASRSKHGRTKTSAVKPTSQVREKLCSGYEAAGVADLLNLLKNYTRVTADQEAETSVASWRSIVVCVIGMPNVGKSSVINSLCGNTNRVRTGNEAGITRELTRIRLTKNVQLLDTPGVIMERENPSISVLRGCLKNFDESVAEEAFGHLLRLPGITDQLVKLYNLVPASEESLLLQIAQRRGLVRKGGASNLEAAVRLVINDWKDGRLSVQAAAPAARSETRSITVVSSASKALNLEESSGQNLGGHCLNGPF